LFFPGAMPKKIAVDPEFGFSKKEKLKAVLKDLSKFFFNSFYETTSDVFFKKGVLKPGKLDIVFVDGLHTFRQSLVDVLNSLFFLQPKGYILLHDCFPPHKASSTPANTFREAKNMNVPGWTGEWCGDVWKTLAYIKLVFPQLGLACLEDDYGLGIVQANANKPGPEYLKIDEDVFKEIDALTYEDLIEKKHELINIIPSYDLEYFLKDDKVKA
jgi:hypothetical protein